MGNLNIKTKKRRDVIDITDEINSKITIADGVVNLFVLHTTASVASAELDPGTDLDLLDAIEAISPKLKYRHPHNPAHANDHIMSTIIGSSITVPISHGTLALGTWQRIVFIELNGPRDRKIRVTQIPVT